MSPTLALRNADRHKRQREKRKLERILDAARRGFSITLPEPREGVRFSIINNSGQDVTIKRSPEGKAELSYGSLDDSTPRQLFRPSAWQRFKAWILDLFRIEIA